MGKIKVDRLPTLFFFFFSIPDLARMYVYVISPLQLALPLPFSVASVNKLWGQGQSKLWKNLEALESSHMQTLVSVC